MHILPTDTTHTSSQRAAETTLTIINQSQCARPTCINILPNLHILSNIPRRRRPVQQILKATTTATRRTTPLSRQTTRIQHPKFRFHHPPKFSIETNNGTLHSLRHNQHPSRRLQYPDLVYHPLRRRNTTKACASEQRWSRLRRREWLVVYSHFPEWRRAGGNFWKLGTGHDALSILLDSTTASFSGKACENLAAAVTGSFLLCS